jgi:hypothetical protein
LLTGAASIKQAAKTIAGPLRLIYTGDRKGDTPGNLPDPYFWWEAGAMFNAFIDYWYYTGDDQYNAITSQAMEHQIGEYSAFMPNNQSKTLGNDDQAFWGMAAMSAAENKLPDLGPKGSLGQCDLQRWSKVADLYLQQRLQLQEYHLQRMLLQHCFALTQVPRKPNLRRLG